jgi:hypothetical protein
MGFFLKNEYTGPEQVNKPLQFLSFNSVPKLPAKSNILTSVPVDYDLYSNEEQSNFYILNQDHGNNILNEKYKLVSIPLQLNNPTTESIRSQQILITPYNCGKY